MQKKTPYGGSRITMLFVSATVFVAITAVFSRTLAVGELLLAIYVTLYYFAVSLRRQGRIGRYLDELMSDLKVAKRKSLLDIPMAVSVLRKNGQIVWANDKFAECTGTSHLFGRDIGELASGVDTNRLDKERLYEGFDASLGERTFRVYGTHTKGDKAGDQLTVLYWNDTTAQTRLAQDMRDSRTVAAIVTVDSYDELAQSLHESEKAGVISRIEMLFGEWTAGAHGLFKSTENGRYLFLCQQRHLDAFVANKFDILDRVRAITVSTKVPVSISIGFGSHGDSIEESYDFARQAIDMALGRGGDQAVIKTKNNFAFYGGRSKGVEKRTKVKSRVMAAALSELLERSSNVLVMGHKFADFDSIGACVGIARAAKVKGKEVNIVVNRDTILAQPVIDSLEGQAGYAGTFVDAGTALDMIQSRTLLVICDTHSPVYVESPELLHSCASVVVIDHHRKMADFIEDTVQFYHEPYASSASEMVSELVQYIDGNSTLTKEEAEALLAGIVLDTKNFYFKTGFRTFEAAAYLRKAGADLITVKRLFKSDYDSYVRRTELISMAQFYRDHFAMSIWDGPRLENAKVVMSQAADELLNIEGVDASFVLYVVGESVHISARSLGNVNVQLILEKLGGGGHLTTAGAQVVGNAEEVKASLRHALDEYLEENTEQ